MYTNEYWLGQEIPKVATEKRPRDKQVATKLQEQEKLLHSLWEKIENLSSILSPILRQNVSDEDADNCEKESLVDLADNIERHNDEIRNRLKIINSIIDRLEI